MSNPYLHFIFIETRHCFRSIYLVWVEKFSLFKPFETFLCSTISDIKLLTFRTHGMFPGWTKLNLIFWSCAHSTQNVNRVCDTFSLHLMPEHLLSYIILISPASLIYPLDSLFFFICLQINVLLLTTKDKRGILNDAK